MSAQFRVEKSAFLPIPASSAFVVSEIGVKAASDGVLVLAFLTINETFACEAVGTLSLYTALKYRTLIQKVIVKLNHQY